MSVQCKECKFLIGKPINDSRDKTVWHITTFCGKPPIRDKTVDIQELRECLVFRQKSGGTITDLLFSKKNRFFKRI